MARVTHESLADRDHPRDDIDRGPRESFEIEEPDDEPSSDRQNLLDPSSSSSTNAAGAGRRGANFDSSLSKRWSKGKANGVGVSFGARAFTRRAVVVVVVFAIVLALATVYIATQAFGEEEEVDVLQFVDPLIGTGRGGHVFAGATLPFGMAKAVADVSGEKQGGFASDGTKVTGFSHLHDSGTGGSPSMGNYPLFAHPSCENDSIQNCKFNSRQRAAHYVNDTVRASPGYFSLELESGLRAEMTVTHRTALYRFTFPHSEAENLQPVVFADAIDLLDSHGSRGMAIDPQTGRMTGNGSFPASFGSGLYHAYFCADFKGARLESVGAFNSSVYPGLTEMSTASAFETNSPGVYARFTDFKPQHDQLLVRVGLSFLGQQRACENAETEIPDLDFDGVLNAAREAWRKKLAPIRLTSPGLDVKHLRNYWSGVYRAFISPQDYTGENPLWNSTEPYYDSWYCIWDTFRGVHPFYTLVDTVSQSRMVRSLIDIYKHEGWMPDCRMSFCKGYTQGGSNADVILVDSFIKKVPGIDWDAAYEALIKDAEVQPPNWNLQGRGGLASWREVGYIPFRDHDFGGLNTRSISRTVEYAYNDFVIALIANATNKPDDYLKYSQRSNNWHNLYKEDHQSLGFTGFLQPRNHDGSWGHQNATLCSPIDHPDSCYLDGGGHETYEGSPWLYTFYVPHDMAKLIATMGGREPFLARLNALHDSGVLYMGDEQAFLTAFLYHYAGRPGLSSARTHSLIPSMFNDTLAGIPGNDDSGAMGTFVFFSMLGIFPNAGQSVYFIIPPFFERVQITHPDTNRTATIRSVHFDAAHRNIYVQSAKLDGHVYTRNWLDHSFFTEGKTLELVLGPKESDWGTREEDVPPSLSTGLFLG